MTWSSSIRGRNFSSKAQSRQELDAFLDIVQFSQTEKIVSLTTQFGERFPKSEFLSQVYRMQMKAYKGLNDYKNTVAAGEKALELNPHDADTLLTLVNVLPYGIHGSDDSSAILGKAESYARRALDEISSLKSARTVPLAEWLKVTAQMKASAHEALGIIAFRRGHYSKSVAEFEICTSQNPFADGAQFYRLGMAYLFNGNPGQARAALKRASELGPDIVSLRAEEQLGKIKIKPH